MVANILIIGSVDGQFLKLTEKLQKVLKKTQLAFALITGDFFADPASPSSEDASQLESVLKGDIKFPLPIYFTIGRHLLPPSVIMRIEENAGEVCENVSYIGRNSVFTEVGGMRIVAAGGFLGPKIADTDSASPTEGADGQYSPVHSEADIKSLRATKGQVDVLLTAAWPEHIMNGSKIELKGTIPTSEKCIADLCMALKPKYHFSSGGESYYEREPFYFPPSSHNPDTRPLTRFVSLASISSKAKSLYAFTNVTSYNPKDLSPTALPAGATLPPFAESSLGKRAAPAPSEGFSRFSNEGRGYHDRDGHGSKRRKKGRHQEPRRPPTQAECFFCLSNPDLATHLITAIGDESYLTTSKGPVPTSSTFAPALDFPAHLLIIPLAHAPTIASIAPPGANGGSRDVERAYAEMARYRNSLNRMLHAKSSGRYGSVCWEISRANGVHVHWQWMPADAGMLGKGLVEAGFRVEAENADYEGKFDAKDLGDGREASGDWFRVWLWDPAGGGEGGGGAKLDNEEAEAKSGGAEVMDEGGGEDGTAAASTNGNGTDDDGGDGPLPGSDRSLVLPLDPVARFDLQFGRRVMAKLLGAPERAHWRDCPQTAEEERRDAEAFKAAFKAWDFSA